MADEWTDDMRRMQLAASADRTPLWRNNVAQGVVGNVDWIRGVPRTVHVSPGDAVVRHARVLHAGLCEGSSDLIGPRPLLIRPEHVGQQMAIFAAIEAKWGTGRKTKLQGGFIDMVNRIGGIAGVARTPDECMAILRKYEA